MTKIVVTVKEHEGVFYAVSEQVPGFLLCSTDKQKLDADVLPALKQLLAIKAVHQPRKATSKIRYSELSEHREFAVA